MRPPYKAHFIQPQTYISSKKCNRNETSPKYVAKYNKYWFSKQQKKHFLQPHTERSNSKCIISPVALYLAGGKTASAKGTTYFEFTENNTNSNNSHLHGFYYPHELSSSLFYSSKIAQRVFILHPLGTSTTDWWADRSQDSGSYESILKKASARVLFFPSSVVDSHWFKHCFIPALWYLNQLELK